MFAAPGHHTAIIPPPTMVLTAPMLTDAPTSHTTSAGGSGVRLLRQCPAEGRFNVLVISGLSWHVSESAVREYLCSLHPQVHPTTVRLYTQPQNGVSRGICFVEYGALALGTGHSAHHSNHTGGHAGSALGGSGALSSSGAGSTNVVTSGRGTVPLFMSGVSTGSAWSASSTASTASPGVEAVVPITSLEDLKRLIESTPFDGTTLDVALYYLTATRWDREGKLPDIPMNVPLPARRMLTGYGSEGFVVRCGPQLGLANTVTPEGAAQLRKLRKRWRAKQRAADVGQRT